MAKGFSVGTGVADGNRLELFVDDAFIDRILRRVARQRQFGGLTGTQKPHGATSDFAERIKEPNYFQRAGGAPTGGDDVVYDQHVQAGQEMCIMGWTISASVNKTFVDVFRSDDTENPVAQYRNVLQSVDIDFGKKGIYFSREQSLVAQTTVGGFLTLSLKMVWNQPGRG